MVNLYSLLLLISLASPLASLSLPRSLSLSVGQVADINVEGFKLHLDYAKEEANKITNFVALYENRLIMIPQKSDIGSHYITLANIATGGKHDLKVIVDLEYVSNCHQGQGIQLWMDIMTELNNKSSLLDQKNAVNDMLGVVNNGNVSHVRLYKNLVDLNSVRDMELDVQSEDDIPNNVPIITMQIICGDTITNEAATVIADLQEEYKTVNVMKGTMKLTKSTTTQFVETTTPIIERTTRGTDNAPSKITSLSTYDCKRGIICDINLPKDLFYDAEDGNTANLSLSVTLAEYKQLNGESVERMPDNFLVISAKNLIMTGLPILEGQYNFRIVAKDRIGQSAAAAFSINVPASGSISHEFEVTVDRPVEKLFETPNVLIGFAKNISTALGDKKYNHVMINHVTPNGTKSIVGWSNRTLNDDVICQHKKIEQLMSMMMTNNRKMTIKKFILAVGRAYHVRDVTLVHKGICNRKSSSNVPSKDVGNDVTVTGENKGFFDESQHFLAIIVSCLFVLVMILLVAYCCCKTKSEEKKNPNDFVSKGLPVVFPEEVPHDEADATVTTPMLIKEERPPLNVTLHDNPLYKAPSVQRDSSIITGASSISKSRQPSSTNTANASQRMPPPYISQ
uniref:Peptidase S72 domain-containing protein n=1 Tax=Rhabditophanes sp. KR3021 TaxID=114890 RepID=A0AC35U4P1_9BILA